MIKVGIIGGAGYTAGELLRILLNHPVVEVSYVKSTSNAGKPIPSIHNDLLGECDLNFSQDHHFDIDVLFLCQGHGKSITFLEGQSIPQGLTIIDLSHDYRLKRDGNSFVYGLPELQKEQIKNSTKIANPGCFATCIQLGVLPLAFKKILNGEIHVHAITGSTGAGALPGNTTHFSWRNNNISVYKVFNHQHLDEINQSLKYLQPNFNHPVNFVPVRGNFTRGIFSSIYTHFEGSIEDAYALYQSFYNEHPFITVSKNAIDLKMVVNTNKGIIHLQKHGNYLYITSIIDNLLKGASGQAVQNMNIIFGLPESEGLKFKPSAF